MTHHQTLYSLRTEGPDFRITKFADGDVESSYTCTTSECTCPAGHRPSCRHRQMLPMMLAHGICDSMWFWNFDNNRVVDFNGTLKSNLDALNELANLRSIPESAMDELVHSGTTIVQHTEDAIVHIPARSWRRL